MIKFILCNEASIASLKYEFVTESYNFFSKIEMIRYLFN